MVSQQETEYIVCVNRYKQPCGDGRPSIAYKFLFGINTARSCTEGRYTDLHHKDPNYLPNMMEQAFTAILMVLLPTRKHLLESAPH